jgi:two-component system sensor kinase FixL
MRLEQEGERERARDSGAPSARPPLAEEQAATIARYKKMYDRSSTLARIGVWEFDLQTGIMTWTDGVYDLFELSRGTSLERTDVVDYYEPESRALMERLRAQAIEEGSSFSVDCKIRTAKGNERWIRLTADVEREDGQSVRIFGTKQDVTAERAAQEEVRALQTRLIHLSRTSAMGAMAATLAHELNQPLAAIANYAAGTRRALQDPKLAAEMVDRGLEAIEDSAQRASRIIRSLREMTNGSALRRETVRLNPLVHEALSLARTDADAETNVRVELAEDLMIFADAVQIQQVLINIIRNAFEAVRGAAQRDLLITTTVAERNVEIRVEDSGAGIAPDLAGRLFETFVSVKPEGMGVGLSISRTIVEAHGGQIMATPGETGGASIRVSLPLADDAAG